MMDIFSSFMAHFMGSTPGSPPMKLAQVSEGGFLSFVKTGVHNIPFLTLLPGANEIGLSPFDSHLIGSNSELFFEIFRTGVFHGLFFSLPFSIPMLICFRRYILDGVSLGHYAFAGTLLGHLSFLFCTIKGIRPIIHFWYPLEPLLSLLGLAFSLKVATDFFSQRRFVFDGTLGSSEDSSTYAINPWPKLPEISWLLPPDFVSKTPPILLALLRLPKTLFTPFVVFLRSFFFSQRLERVRIPFQKFQSFCEKNLGPSIFTFQFFLMWLNPASASTLNLLFFEHDILQGVFFSSNSPVFLVYTIGFVSAAGVLCTFILFVISQLAGRNFSLVQFFPSGSISMAAGASGQSSLFQSTSRLQQPTKWAQFDEALAQNRFKIFNKFFAFLIIGCVVQGGLNYTWRLFLQYPLELIRWDFFPAFTKNLGIFDRSEVAFRELHAPKEPFQKAVHEVNAGQPNPSERRAPHEVGLDPQKGSAVGKNTALLTTKLPNEFGFSLPFSQTDTASSFLTMKNRSSSPLRSSTQRSWVLFSEEDASANIVGNTEESLSIQTSGGKGELESANQSEQLPTAAHEVGSLAALNFFGRREFPPYDTSIRNREKSLPVERHLAIERVNSRRGLMGRPPLENEERENAIFKYHTFFMNQIDRSVEDLKMKLGTPSDLYREENDILALQKLHENYLKQKGRESEYQNSVMKGGRGSSGAEQGQSMGSAKRSQQKTRTLPRHPRDFFTKSRPVTNTTKGFSKSSYIRDLFDDNLPEAYSAYSHDDLLLSKIISNSALGRR